MDDVHSDTSSVRSSGETDRNGQNDREYTAIRNIKFERKYTTVENNKSRREYGRYLWGTRVDYYG
jgi:hypothetical protein